MIRGVTGEAVEREKREKKPMQLRNISKKDKVSNGNDGPLVENIELVGDGCRVVLYSN